MSLETMTKLSTVTVGVGGVSSVSFSNIPQTYTDLVVRVSARSTRNNATYPVDNLNIAFNGTSAGVSVQQRNLYTYEATGSQVVASSNDTYLNNFMIKADGGTASTFGGGDIYISNYTSFNHKAISLDSVAPNNSTKAWLMLNAGVSLNTAPITSIEMFAASGNLVQYSTFTLYGVKSMRAASGNSIKATGGSVKFDGTYVTHTFNTSGSFTPTTNLLVNYLVVAGGGGGGGELGGGGGAGGLRSTVTATGGGGTLETALSLTAQAYTVTIGAGGTAGIANTAGGLGGNGTDSTFSTITSTGGGAGARAVSSTNGGSGGGAGQAQTAGTGTANQGFAGGTSTQGPDAYGAGGGGGANAAGVNGLSTSGGNGGAGVTTSISGSSVTYAGGGGGGVYTALTDQPEGQGGAGGGGKAGNTTFQIDAYGFAGTANTGGGGGGAVRGTNTTGNYQNGGAGGSGIVIIRYKG